MHLLYRSVPCRPRVSQPVECPGCKLSVRITGVASSSFWGNVVKCESKWKTKIQLKKKKKKVHNKPGLCEARAENVKNKNKHNTGSGLIYL